jgi:hypothetical protein
MYKLMSNTVHSTPLSADKTLFKSQWSHPLLSALSLNLQTFVYVYHNADHLHIMTILSHLFIIFQADPSQNNVFLLITPKLKTNTASTPYTKHIW